MTHRSGLEGFVIDCQTEDLAEAMAFWSAALGATAELDADGRYAHLAGAFGGLDLLIQAVDHAPRIHLDLKSDDIEAEVARLEALGARRIGPGANWIVMEAPTGHRFCIVGRDAAKIGDDATTWDGN
ncbi:VOC family protein [Amorphus sp. MBR-141]